MASSNAQPRLSAYWAAVAPHTAASRACLDNLLSRYREAHRHYHGIAHVDRVVADTVDLLGDVAVPDQAAVRFAAFFHDAIYDPRSMTNEADSAALGERELAALGISVDRRTEVARLVLLTRDHSVDDDDVGGCALLDADLAVLGALPAAYQAYVAGVRAEYAHVDEDAWRVGRAAVLRQFLTRERLFHTQPMAAHEARARSNLRAELAALEPPATQR